MEARNTILIIDDDPRNIFALSAVLKSRGYESHNAVSVDEGLAFLQQNRAIGIILLDMMMPGLDGYQAIPLIRASGNYSDVPIIAVTAQAMAGDREKCLAAGANDYISKPIDVDKLTDTLQQYLK